jgi:transposase
MGPTVAELVAWIIDRVEDRPLGRGRPLIPTIEVIETLRFFVREGVQWRELRAADGRASGSTLRRRLDEWHRTALLRRVHAILVRMARSGPDVPAVIAVATVRTYELSTTMHGEGAACG